MPSVEIRMQNEQVYALHHHSTLGPLISVQDLKFALRQLAKNPGCGQGSEVRGEVSERKKVVPDAFPSPLAPNH